MFSLHILAFLFIGLSVYYHMYFILKYFKAEMRKGLMQPQPDVLYTYTHNNCITIIENNSKILFLVKFYQVCV